MTTQGDTNHAEIEQLLKTMRPAEPSASLKERVVGAARQAWHEAATDPPWRIAIGRLAAAAVAAVFIVSCANYLSNRAIARWQPQGPTAANAGNSSLDEFPEESFGPFLKHVAALRATAGRDGPGMLAYRERLQEAIVEVEPGGPAAAPGPAESRSRLLPAPNESLYS